MTPALLSDEPRLALERNCLICSRYWPNWSSLIPSVPRIQSRICVIPVLTWADIESNPPEIWVATSTSSPAMTSIVPRTVTPAAAPRGMTRAIRRWIDDRRAQSSSPTVRGMTTSLRKPSR